MLAYETFDAGEHSLVWDGRDRDGNEAGAGVYFVRVSIPGTRFTRRIVRVR
jgi:flagellar hook assembly protein FlgD